MRNSWEVFFELVIYFSIQLGEEREGRELEERANIPNNLNR